MDIVKTQITISLGICLLISGCLSIGYRTDDDSGRIVAEGIYPGVRVNTSTLYTVWTYPVDSESTSYRIFWTPILLVDLPFSAIVDTVCLPYDLLNKKDTEKEPNHH